MKKPINKMTLTVEFSDLSDLRAQFEKVIENVGLGQQNVKGSHNSLEYKYLYHPVITEAEEVEEIREMVEHRYEVIDGKTCLIIPSKLNNQK
jgi:hypothetical protein